MPDPVMGDTAVVTEYWDYRDLGTIKFPMRMRQTLAGTPCCSASAIPAQRRVSIPGSR